jgi:L-amino acid N-acyltransferase YncA
LARSFPHFASRLGYRSSVFNLVFESNVASLRLWDQLGYRRVGRLQDAIKIRGKWTAAIIYQGDFLDGSIDTTFKDLS